MKTLPWERIAAILICIAFGGALGFLLLRYAAPVLLPFALAWLISLPLTPLSKAIAKRFHLPQKLCAVILLTSCVALGAWGLVALAWRLLLEAGHLVEQLLSGGGLLDAMERGMLWLEEWGASFPFLHRGDGSFRDGVYAMLRELLSGVLSSVSASLPSLAAGLFSALPTVFFVAVISILAGYYFCVDGERIKHVILSLLPHSLCMRFAAWKRGGRSVFRAYCKAYLTLLLLTFSLLFVGLLILGISPAFLIALLVAFLDLLPIIGVGTVMVPWGLILLIQNEYYTGFGVLILYLIVELVRQVAEPKLLGKNLGLHPLMTLFATFVGFYWFGFVGMILSPIAAVAIKSIGAAVRAPREPHVPD